MTESDEHAMYRFEASPVFWQQRASGLRHAAYILWPEADRQLHAAVAMKKKLDPSVRLNTFDVFLGLIGHSTENLFKGLLVRDNPNVISNGRLVRRGEHSILNHDLIGLARRARVPLSNHERIFCELANDCMIGTFRYPVKSSADQNLSIEVGGHPKEVFEGLYQRLFPELNFYSFRPGEMLPARWGEEDDGQDFSGTSRSGHQGMD